MGENANNGTMDCFLWRRINPLNQNREKWPTRRWIKWLPAEDRPPISAIGFSSKASLEEEDYGRMGTNE